MYRPTPSHRSHQQQQDNLRPPKMPERPLVPYMRFSKKVWPKVRADNPDSPLWDLGKVIGQLWNTAAPAEKAIYQQEYEADKAEYEKAMKHYNNSYAQYMSAKNRVKSVVHQQEKGVSSSGRKSGADTSVGLFIQPIEEEDPFDMAGKRLTAIRYGKATHSLMKLISENINLEDRNNRLMSELFSSNYLPDPRTFVPQQRIEHFRRQRQSLETHQQKSNEELARLEERKRAIQKDAEAYEEELKRVCAEKPRLDQTRYEELTEEYKEQMLQAWEQYQEKQAAIQAKQDAERRANPVLSELITAKSPQEGGADAKADGPKEGDGKQREGDETDVKEETEVEKQKQDKSRTNGWEEKEEDLERETSTKTESGS